MSSQPDVLQAEKSFFASLLQADVSGLEQILADDFTLTDLTGSLMTKAALMDAIGSGRLRFTRIDPIEFEIRLFGTTAVVTGRTEMAAAAGGVQFQNQSRYTHVYVLQAGGWRLAAAQGTQASNLAAV